MNTLAAAKADHDNAAREVQEALAILTERIARINAQMNGALNEQAIALDSPEWVSQDALKVTVALANYKHARTEYGNAINGTPVR